MEPWWNQGRFRGAEIFILVGVPQVEPSGSKVGPRQFSCGRGVYFARGGRVKPSGSKVEPSGIQWNRGGTKAVFATQGCSFSYGLPRWNQVEPRWNQGGFRVAGVCMWLPPKWNQGGTKVEPTWDAGALDKILESVSAN